MAEKEIVCVGNMTRDEIYEVESIPLLDEVATVHSTRTCFGGRGAIVAVITALLGARVRLLTTLPARDAAEVTAFLQQHGVDSGAVSIDSRATRMIRIIVTVGRREQNCISLFVPSDVTFAVSRAQIDAIRGASLAYFTSHAIPASLSLLREVDPRQTRVVHNFGTYMLAYSAYMEELLSRSVIIVANEHEYTELRRTIGLEDASVFTAAPILERVYVTRGSAGVRVIERSGDTLDMPPTGSVDVRTPVGVGDAFAAGIVFAEHSGAGVADGLRLGLRLAEASLSSDWSLPEPDAVRHLGRQPPEICG